MNNKQDGWRSNETYKPTDEWIQGREDALELIRDERRQQFIKWGEHINDDGTWMKILAEEFGEVARAMLAIQFPKEGSSSGGMRDHLRLELAQLAAVSAAIIQQIDQGKA